MAEETTPQHQEEINSGSENQAMGNEHAEDTANEFSETDKLSAELAEMKDKYMRLYADFDNFRKRTNKERIDIIQTAATDTLEALLPVLDDFERAIQSFETTDEVGPLKEGVELIHHKLNTILQSKGLRPMNAQHEDFDPDLHECVTQFAAGDELKGKVVDVLTKGYFLNDKVLRFAKVVVGN